MTYQEARECLEKFINNAIHDKKQERENFNEGEIIAAYRLIADGVDLNDR
ncbi:MAG: hypothetical protein ACPG4J_04440 [Lentibacter algarum]